MPTNATISEQFELLSKLMDIHQENSFKSKSYSSAAFAIDKLPFELETFEKGKIASIKGIGESSAKKIIEILETERLSVLDELINKTPEGVLDMLRIKGLGPKKIATIWHEMGIETIGELLYACNENHLLLYKGFGEKTQKNVAEAIEFFMRNQGHFLYADVESYVEKVHEILSARCPANRFSIGGDFFRQMPTLDELIWITDAPLSLVQDFLAEIAFSIESNETDQFIAKGPENLRMLFIHTASTNIDQIQFEKSVNPAFLEEWKKNFNTQNISSIEPSNWITTFGINYIPPFLREDPSIIEAAKNNRFDDLITTDQIKGIIHSHSNWSDGSNTIEEMAQACIAQGFEYLVISDHSKSAFYANGLNEERIKAQHQYIDELNSKYAPFKIFKSIESDILNDGALDYSDNLLSTFDMVIASVHSNLKMAEEKAMSRLLTAIENRYSTVLGHPTGRLLLSRKGYPIDHEKIIDACIANKVAIEINAHPRRLDLDWTWIKRAQDKGAILSINPDAHHVDGYHDVKYGVLAAQKGGLKKENNLSSFSLNDFEEYLNRVKKA
ncbi:MAG: helix-hairpin-helix domain-containing protein [Chitinophagaceae bacterium]